MTRHGDRQPAPDPELVQQLDLTARALEALDVLKRALIEGRGGQSGARLLILLAPLADQETPFGRGEELGVALDAVLERCPEYGG